MNLLAAFLVWVAILTSVLTVGLLLAWWRGVDMLALPGLGIIVALPLVVLLLLLAEVATVVVAMFVRGAGTHS